MRAFTVSVSAAAMTPLGPVAGRSRSDGLCQEFSPWALGTFWACAVAAPVSVSKDPRREGWDRLYELSSGLHVSVLSVHVRFWKRRRLAVSHLN